MKRHHTIYLLIAALFLLPLIAACSGSEDNPESATHQRALFRLNARADSDASPAELINSWWIVLADASGKVSYIFDRPADKSDAVEWEEIYAEIRPGKYTVYAFANLSRADLKERTGLEFVQGASMPADADNAVWATFANGYPSYGMQIPMSGRQTINVTGAANQTYSIEVVRMVAKMTFAFASRGRDLSISSITINPMTDGPLLLFTDIAYLGGRPITTPGATTTPFTHTLTTPLAVTASADASAPRVETSFYVREGVADSHPTGHYAISIETQGSTPDSQARMEYALADELTFINRNDHIYIPITLTEYSLRLKCLFYPPIGGYPAVMVEERNSEYYVKFGTEGAFAITPTVYDLANDTANLGSDIVKVTIDGISDPSGVFSTLPAMDSTTGEITGSLSGSKGTATVTLSINVKVSATVSRVFSRKIYIIQE